jgi:hypothetical protein
MSIRLPGSRSNNERSPERQSFPPRIVVEGQYPSIVTASKPLVPPSAGETPSRLSYGSSTPSLRPVNRPPPPMIPQQYQALPPVIPVPTASTSYQQLLTDLAGLRATNTERSPTQSSPSLNPDGLQWSTPSTEKFYEIKALLGTEPDFVLPKSQGLAIWLQPRGRYHSLEVRDRSPTLLSSSSLVLRFPKQLREKTIKHLYKLAPSAWYEKNANLIGVQTDTFDRAILTLALIKEAERERADTARLESPVRDALERYIMAEN